MSLKIVALENTHLEDAAGIVSRRYRALRCRMPELPARYEDGSVLLELLGSLAGEGRGVAALCGGQLAGFLTGYLTPVFRGQATVYSPEWANGAAEDGARRIYEEMYAVGARQWVGAGFFDHYVTLLGYEPEEIDAWHGLGFGDVVRDGLRDLSRLAPACGDGGPADVEIRRATPADFQAVLPLYRGLLAHLSSAPVFLTDAAESKAEDEEAWLADPANALWAAFRGSEAIAMLGLGPANHNACTIIRDEGTSSIMSAFTRPEARGLDVATRLLQHAVEWARAAGYVRCAVDFETANLQATRFWSRHFQIICRSLGRRVNPYIAMVTRAT